MSLTAGSGFTITSNIYANSACSGSTAELYPGTTRYICFTVQNNLNVPITVGSISMALSNTPPTGCTAGGPVAADVLWTVERLQGAVRPATTGLPIELKDDGDQSPQCENQTLDFTYSGSAQYTDSTTTSLASSSPGNTSTYWDLGHLHGDRDRDERQPGSLREPCWRHGHLLQLHQCVVQRDAHATRDGDGRLQRPGHLRHVHAARRYGLHRGGLRRFWDQPVRQHVQRGHPDGELGHVSTTSVLTSAPNPSTYGSSVTFTDTVSASSGTPGGTVTFYSCGSSSSCATPRAPRSGPGRSTARARPPTRPRPSRWAPPTSRRSTAASGNYGGSTSNVVSQVVNALGTTSVLTSSPNPSTYGSSVTFTDTVSASSGTPGGTVTFYSCTTSAARTKTSLGTGTLNSSARPPYSTSSLPGGHHLRRGDLRGLGQLRRLDVERGDPGGQRGLDHLGLHLVAQPVDLRHLGHLLPTRSRPLRARRAAR